MRSTPPETTPLFAEVPTEDANVLGFFNLFILQKKYDIVIDYVPNWSERITGVIKGRAEDIKAVFAALEHNEPVGARDLVDSIKFVRAKIFQEKQRHSESKKWSGTRGPR